MLAFTAWTHLDVLYLRLFHSSETSSLSYPAVNYTCNSVTAQTKCPELPGVTMCHRDDAVLFILAVHDHIMTYELFHNNMI